MCNFFSCIATQQGTIHFTEEDSHETCIERLQTQQDLVRIEIKDGVYALDTGTIPEWYERLASRIEQQAMKTYNAVIPCHTRYIKIYDIADAEYHKIHDPAAAEYHKIHDPAAAECNKIHDPAAAECNKIRNTAWTKYDKISDIAEAECNKIHDPANVAFIHELSSIEGYISAKSRGVE